MIVMLVQKILYLIYFIEWKLSHRGRGFKGCTPAYFAEWCICELQEMLDKPEWYDDLWYYPLVEYLREECSKEF